MLKVIKSEYLFLIVMNSVGKIWSESGKNPFFRGSL